MGQTSLKRQQNLDEHGFTTKSYKSIDGRRPIERQTFADRLTVWHLNIGGLKNDTHIDKLRTIIHNSAEKPDIIGISETHLPQHEEYGLPPDISGYNAYHNNHQSDSGGT